MKRTGFINMRRIAGIGLLTLGLSACSLGAPEVPIELTQPVVTATPLPATSTPTATASFTPLPVFTSTPLPAPTLAPTQPPVTAVSQQLAAQIVAGIGHTYVHDAPSLAGKVVVQINEFAPLQLVGRSDDGLWFEAILDGGTRGWLLSRELNVTGDWLALPVTATANGVPDAYVSLEGQGLRLRQSPGFASAVQLTLDSLDALRLLGRTADNTWYEVQTGTNQTGWVAAEFVEARIATDDLPITGQILVSAPTAVVLAPNLESPPLAPINTNANYAYVSGITETTRQIYQQGLVQGNRSNVFSKIGDSITVATWVMYPMGWGQTQYGDYGNLQPVVSYFSAANARNGNSFANISLAADNGWTTTVLLDPNRGNPEFCQSGESPLLCEYRNVKPAIAIILIGTNDIGVMSADQYRANLQQIVALSAERGVIPVLTTIPDRYGFDVSVFNQIVRETSQGYGVPLVDYAAALRSAPNAGLSPDGVHPSFPPQDGDWAAAANFRDNLHYGYTIRNLTILYALDAVWREVLQK